VIDDMSGKPSCLRPLSTPHSAARQGRWWQRRGVEAVGKAIERSIEKGIKRVVFDRSGFLYHGRIRAVADAERKAGLEF
jgi:large subunit ribosomal protein L18